MKDCLFCKIVSGEIPSTKVAEDNVSYVFEDINPQAPVHLLIVPKAHIDFRATDDEIDYEVFQNMMRMAKRVAALKNLDKSGFRLIINNGSDAGQEVDHLHLHVLGGKPLGKMIST